ncbi:hypothetical protein LCGC14_2725840 [marine sediment metagenome]|uniref:Uncharacterized protein n=1 Tax=marine sediment metagenome TaxID=412755 RepID=A0A0F8Z8T5_9ZZZZ
MVKIKQLCVIDTAIKDLGQVIESLQMQHDHYMKETDGEVGFDYKIIRKDLAWLPWIVYGYKDYRGVLFQWLAGDTIDVDKTQYSVCYIFDDSNWREKRIHGWHVGFINGVSVQLLRAIPNSTSHIPNLGTVPTLYLGILEEMMHSWDNVISKELGINLSKKFGVDWDEGVVHGNSDVQRWVYLGVIRRLKPYLLKLFKEDKNHMEHIILVGGDQYILVPEIKLAYKILDVATLHKLQANGLGNPTPSNREYLKDYVIVPDKQAQAKSIIDIVKKFFSI